MFGYTLIKTSELETEREIMRERNEKLLHEIIKKNKLIDFYQEKLADKRYLANILGVNLKRIKLDK